MTDKVEILITDSDLAVRGVDPQFLATILEAACHPVAVDHNSKVLTVSVSHKHLLERIKEPKNLIFLTTFINVYFFAPEDHYDLVFVLESEFKAQQKAIAA